MKPYVIGMYEKAVPGDLTWAGKMDAAVEAGYDFIEMSVDETDAKLARLDWSAEERWELTALMRRKAMPIRTMCLSGHRKYPMGDPDPETEKRGMEIMEKAIELADDLGIRIIQLAGYDVYYKKGNEETSARFVRNLKKAAEMAAKKGIVMGFETMETDFMNTVEKSMRFVNEVNSPYLGVYPDLGNITNAAVAAGTRAEDDLETGRGHLVAMHLKETVPKVFREVRFGTGHVDFAAGIQKAWSLGVRLYVTELWYTGNPAWREELQEAVTMMKEHLDRLK